MSYAPMTAPWVGLMMLALVVLVALIDVLALLSRRDRGQFPGGSRRLVWAIAIHAVGLIAIFAIVLFLPMSLLYAAGAALGLPEWCGYLISFVAAGAGAMVGMRIERRVVSHLESPLLADREKFLAGDTKREGSAS